MIKKENFVNIKMKLIVYNKMMIDMKIKKLLLKMILLIIFISLNNSKRNKIYVFIIINKIRIIINY